MRHLKSFCSKDREEHDTFLNKYEYSLKPFILLVPAARLELARPEERQILSLLCLPIPPRGRRKQIIVNSFIMQEHIL